jgi:SAM-dependent methyltransferase
MRDSIKEFVKICAESLPINEPIYEFGSLQVSGQEGYADLRPFFIGKKYVGADMRKGPGVDEIHDLYNINLSPESVGTVLILDTLEHVEFVREAIKEAYRILKKDGVLVISSVMNYPIHDHPYDYWRFTPESFRSLLKPFAYSIVEFAGKDEFPHTVVGVGFKSPAKGADADEFIVRLASWKKRWFKPNKKTLKIILRESCPLLHRAYQRCKSRLIKK